MLAWIILLAQISTVHEQYDRGAEVGKTIDSMIESDTALIATCTADGQALARVREIERELGDNVTGGTMTSSRDSIRELLESESPLSSEMTAVLHRAQVVLDAAVDQGHILPETRETFHHHVVDPAADCVRRNAIQLLGRLMIMRDLNERTGSAVHQLESGLLEAAKRGL